MVPERLGRLSIAVVGDFVALAQQKEIRGRSVKAGRREDGSARLLLAFTPGFLEVWEAGLSAERLPGLDYDVAIRDAIIEGSDDPAAAAATRPLSGCGSAIQPPPGWRT